MGRDTRWHTPAGSRSGEQESRASRIAQQSAMALDPKARGRGNSSRVWMIVGGVVLLIVAIIFFVQFHVGSHMFSRFQDHSMAASTALASAAAGKASSAHITHIQGELNSHKTIIAQQTATLNKILDHLKDKGVDAAPVASLDKVQEDLNTQCEKAIEEKIAQLKRELPAAPFVQPAVLGSPEAKPCPPGNQGGGKGPGGCKVLGICIPYRDRADHLEIFAIHMNYYLKDQGIPFRIYVAEQNGYDPFNRGWALNMAFKMAEKETDYVVLHDVDMLPLPGVDYSYPQREYMHMAMEASQFDFKNPYHRYCGGVFLIDNKLFRQFDGYSTDYWGWGGEDDDFCLRLMRVKFPQHNGWPPGRNNGAEVGMPRPRMGNARFMSISASHQTRENPFYDHNVRHLHAYERQRGGPPPDGLSTTGEPDALTVEIDARPLYIRKKINFPPGLTPPNRVGKQGGPHGGAIKQGEWVKGANGRWVRSGGQPGAHPGGRRKGRRLQSEAAGMRGARP